MLSQESLEREYKRLPKLLKAALRKDVLQDGVLELAMDLRNQIWTLDWILNEED